MRQAIFIYILIFIYTRIQVMKEQSIIILTFHNYYFNISNKKRVMRIIIMTCFYKILHYRSRVATGFLNSERDAMQRTPTCNFIVVATKTVHYRNRNTRDIVTRCSCTSWIGKPVIFPRIRYPPATTQMTFNFCFWEFYITIPRQTIWCEILLVDKFYYSVRGKIIFNYIYIYINCKIG